MSKITSKEQIKVLLENTSQEVRSTLLNSSQQTNKYFYENFTSVSLKGLKYIASYIDLINKDQEMQRIIDRLIKDFTHSLKEYKARNIYIHSTHLQEEEQNEEDDEIYHFMNTRNNLLATQCLSNYDNQKQRKELQEFVQQISKKKLPQKESKRSLLLPKDNTFNLKLGRKTTFDPDIFIHQTQESSPVQYVHFPVISQTIEIQTEVLQEECQEKKSEIEIFSQCQSLLPSEGATLQNIVTSKLKTSNSLKKKEKKKLPNEDHKKKKAKFQPTSDKNRDKDVKQRKEECSLKLVKINQHCLAIKSKEVDIIVNNYIDASERENSQETNQRMENVPFNNESKQLNMCNENTTLTKKSSIEGEQMKQTDQKVHQSTELSKQDTIKSSKSDKHLQIANLTKSKKHLIAKANLPNVQTQKIPTSGIRILESFTTNQNESISSVKEGELKASQNRLGCMKKKRFTGDRHLFQNCNLTEGNNEKLNTSAHLRASKLIIPQLGKKASNESEQKNNESFASTPSQDYLASRQESQLCFSIEKSEQNALQPIRIPRRSLQSCVKGINFNGQRRTSNPPNNSSNENADRMIIVSNQPTHTGGSSNQGQSLFQNNALQSSIDKENTPGKGINAKHSFLKRSYLQTISEAKSSEGSSRLLISKLRQANRSVQVSPNEHSRSNFYRLSSQKAQLSQTTSLLTPKDDHSRYGESSSCHSSSFQLGEVKRTLRNRASKLKLEHYLQLVETMHQKLCGVNCQHIRQIRQAKQGDVGEQLLSLLTRQK